MLNISKIRELSKEHGWSASSFCNFFGKNSGWLADMERGRGMPDENTLRAFADKLDTTVDYLTDKTDKKNKPPMLLSDLTPYELDLIMKLREGPEEVTAAVYRAAGVDPERK